MTNEKPSSWLSLLSFATHYFAIYFLFFAVLSFVYIYVYTYMYIYIHTYIYKMPFNPFGSGWGDIKNSVTKSSL